MICSQVKHKNCTTKIQKAKKTINPTNPNNPAILELSEKKNKTLESTFETITLEAVDEVLSSLGQSCKLVIYLQLEKTFKIRKNEIALRIEDFANAIEQIFGAGAKLIELRIIEALHGKIPDFVFFPNIKDIVFTEYVAGLNRFFTITEQSSTSVFPLQRK